MAHHENQALKKYISADLADKGLSMRPIDNIIRDW